MQPLPPRPPIIPPSPRNSGKARSAILLWLLGIPIPIIILIFVLKSCVS